MHKEIFHDRAISCKLAFPKPLTKNKRHKRRLADFKKNAGEPKWRKAYDIKKLYPNTWHLLDSDEEEKAK